MRHLWVVAPLAAAAWLTAVPAIAQTVAPEAEIRIRTPKFDKPLPGGTRARGTRNIIAAWLSGATQRYRHFVLGAEHEAETLVVSTSERRVFQLTLPADSVFEDREPRIVDVDGDGVDEVIVVRSYLRTGSALAIAKIGPSGLTIVAETPPLGAPFRWLNPAGVGDFDGDGRPDIALVVTPHVRGQLQIWTLDGVKLKQTFEIDDVSNHATGSRAVRLSAVADFNGDGVADLAIPSGDRRSLRFLSFKGGQVVEFARIDLPGPAAEDFQVVERDGRPAVVVGLNGGRTVTVQP